MNRATAVDPAFCVDQANAGTIAEICRQLDGLPLAIELAAARSKFLPPSALLLRLERRLPLLTGGPRDAPARLRTMHDAIAWSYDLLPADEQRLFRCLSNFSGGVTLEAAEWVMSNASRSADDEHVRASGETPENAAAGRDTPRMPDAASLTLERVGSLIDKSLLHRLEPHGEDASFGMLETIREFGRDRLASLGELEHVREAHARYCEWVAEQSFTGVHGRDHQRWMRRSELMHDDIVAALTWLEETDQFGAIQRIVGRMYRFWYIRGRLHDGRIWSERSLRHNDGDKGVTRAWALLSAGWLAWAQGDYDNAERYAVSSLHIFETHRLTEGVAEAWYVLGVVAEDNESYDAATERLQRALDMFRARNELSWIGFALNALGLVAYERGDHTAAIDRFEEALATFREVGELHGTGFALTNLGKTMLSAGDLTKAAAYFHESLAIRREYGEQVAVAGCLRGLAAVACRLGDMDRAARLLGASDRLREAIGLQELRRRGRNDDALTLLRQRLGSNRLDREVQRGRTLTLADVIAEADAVHRVAVRAGGPDATMSVGKARLSPRELDVLRLLVQGLTDSQIADALYVSRRTITTHTQHIFAKLGVANRVEATALAMSRDLVPARDQSV